MKKFTLLFALALLAGMGAHAVTINVPADHATIQAAINAAASGDIIQIADGTYTEDLNFTKNAGVNQSGITLQGSSPQNVIINAANTRVNNDTISGTPRSVLGVIGQAFGAGAAPDTKGCMVEANDITLRNLTFNNDNTGGDVLFGESAAVLVGGNNCTIDNCILRVNSDNDSGRALYVLTGDYSLLNGGALAGLYPAPGFEGLNMTVTDTQFINGDSTIDTVDAAFYIHIFLGQTSPLPPVRVGTGTFTNCEVFCENPAAGGDIGEVDGGTYTFTNTHFHDFGGGMVSGGGTWNYVGCFFERSNGGPCARTNWSGEGGLTLPQLNFADCVFCGHANAGDGMIKFEESVNSVAGCIFSVTNTATQRAIEYRPGDYDGDWLLFGGYPGPTSVLVDHCDFFNPTGEGIHTQDNPDGTEPAGTLTVSNSIFECLEPIKLDGAAGTAVTTAIISNNNLYPTGNVTTAGGWTLTETANLNVFPNYSAPGCPADPSDPSAEFSYINAALAGAGNDASDLGSQGAVGGAATSSVENWQLY